MGSLKAEDVEYDKWKEKIARLDSKLSSVDKIVQSMSMKKEQLKSAKSTSSKSTRNQVDNNFEYDMLSKLKTDKMSHKLQKNKVDKIRKKKYISNNSDDDDDDSKGSKGSYVSEVDLAEKVLNEIKNDVRSYREAAQAIMKPLGIKSKRELNGEKEKCIIA